MKRTRRDPYAQPVLGLADAPDAELIAFALELFAERYRDRRGSEALMDRIYALTVKVAKGRG